MDVIPRKDLQYAVLLTAIESIADASLKAASQRPGAWLSPISAGLYILMAYILQTAIIRHNLGIVNAAWNAGTTIMNVFIGMYFGETYTLKQLSGIALIALGILIL
jgi:multidrug transporter EmrE-like cation transporter